MSSRASTVVTLVLLGSALAFIGWYLYSEWQGPNHRWGTGHSGFRGYHGGYYGIFGGGSRGSSGSSPRPSSSFTSRGGFGATGAGAGG